MFLLWLKPNDSVEGNKLDPKITKRKMQVITRKIWDDAYLREKRGL